MKFKIALILLFLTPAILLPAQEKVLRFRHLTIEQGLSQSTVLDIVQDTTGYMWFATRDGLNRYDGYNIKIFRNVQRDSTSLAASYVRCLLVDSKGQLWVGTQGGGLDLFDQANETFKHYLKDSLSPKISSLSYVNCIFEDHSHQLWIGTKGGLVNFNPDTHAYKVYHSNYIDTNTLSDNKIETIAEDSNGHLWIGTLESGVCSFDKATGKVHRYSWQYFPPYKPGIMVGRKFNKIMVIGGKIWTSNQLGVNILDPLTGVLKYKRIYPGNIRDSNMVFENNLYLDPSGKIWVSFFDQGFGILDTVYWKCPIIKNIPGDAHSLNLNSINCLYYDKTGNLWLGLNGAGVDLNAKSKFDHYKSSLGLPDANSIRTIIKDHNGNIYVGGYGGLLMTDSTGKLIKNFSYNKSKPADNLLGRMVYTLCEDVDGKIWIGYEGLGLQLYDPATGKFVKHWQVFGPGKDQIPDLVVFKVFRDSSGYIWIGTMRGLVAYDRASGKMVQFIEKGQPYDIAVRDIKDDGPNGLWLATESGLMHLDKQTGKFKLFAHDKNDPNTIGSNMLRSIYKDNYGVLWVANEGSGVDRINFKPGPERAIASVQHYTIQEGFPSSVAYGILEDKHGFLWISTNNGICRLDRKGNIVSFSVDDGLQSKEFNAGAYYKSPRGTMYFGGINGLNVFNPDKIVFDDHPPKVILTGFKIFNKDKILAQPLSLTKNIRLGTDEDFFSFEFAALDFTAPEKNEYAYKLEGFDEDWINAGNRRYASYTNLPSGNYIFKVKACNSDHVWNNQGVSIKLTIVPPFWYSKWFILLMAAIITIGTSYAIRFRIKRLREKQKLLEDKVKVQSEKLKMERLKMEVAISKALIEGQNNEQKRISEDLHDSLGQTLTAANLNLMALEGDIQAAGIQANSRLESLKNLMQNAIVEVRNISHNLMPNLMAEEGLEAALTELCRRTMYSSKLEIILKIQDLPQKLNSSLEISFYRIVQEIINNTLKHAGAQRLFISIVYKNNRVLLETEDNGVGFDTSINKSKGLGLKNISIRVEMLNGAYHINSTRGRGTVISIEIPAV